MEQDTRGVIPVRDRNPLGMRLVDALVEQIDGTLVVEGTSGVVFRIAFPLLP
jgi:two-component sensor histidine kinase